MPVGRDPLGNTCCRVPAPSAGAKRRDSPARHAPFTGIRANSPPYRPIPLQAALRVDVIVPRRGLARQGGLFVSLLKEAGRTRNGHCARWRGSSRLVRMVS